MFIDVCGRGEGRRGRILPIRSSEHLPRVLPARPPRPLLVLQAPALVAGDVVEGGGGEGNNAVTPPCFRPGVRGRRSGVRGGFICTNSFVCFYSNCFLKIIY